MIMHNVGLSRSVVERAGVSSGSSCDNLNDCRPLSSIIFTSLATLAACTWASVHPNIPGPRDGRIVVALRRSRLMLLALIAPEIIVLWALRQRMVAHGLAKAHFMTAIHGFFVSMGGYEIPQDHGYGPVTPQMVGTVGGAQLREIMSINSEHISDRSKGDEWTKGLAIIQTAWFITQCIARRVQHLSITELELVTLAFALINIVIYVLWWDKPLDVRFPVRLRPQSRSRAPDVLVHRPGNERTWIQTCSDALGNAVNTVVQTFFGEDEAKELPIGATEVPMLWAGFLPLKQRSISAGVATLVAICFGGIHCIAWNFSFPSETERYLWRVASVIVASVPALFFLVAYLLLSEVLNPDWFISITLYLILPIGVISYISARMILMILPFLSLRSLPFDAYVDVDWTAFIPHIS